MVGPVQLDASLPDSARRKRRTWPGPDEHYRTVSDLEPCGHVSRLSLLWMGCRQAGTQAVFDSLYALRRRTDSVVRSGAHAVDHSCSWGARWILWHRILCRVGDHWQ